MDIAPYYYTIDYQLPSSFSLLSSIIKMPPEVKPDNYQELVCTEEDQACIYEIITTIAENNKLSLLIKKNHLRGLGVHINHVHPLKFLSTIVSHPHLRFCLIDIFGDYFKKNGFMDGIGPSLTRESEKNKLQQFIGDFAKEVAVSPEDITPFFTARDWEGLVAFFIPSEKEKKEEE